MLNATKQKIARILTNNLVGGLIGTLFPIIKLSDGVRVNIRSRWVSNRIRAYLFWGMYESAETRCIAKYLPGDLPVVELGASLGVVSTRIAKKQPPLHIAIEANPHLIPLIRENLMMNGIDKTVILNMAISYSDSGKAAFQISDDNTGSSLYKGGGVLRPESIVEVDCAKLSEIAAKFELTRYILVADIEGAESSIIEFDGVSLRNECAMMIIELHDTYLNGNRFYRKDLRNKLADLGFREVAADGDVFVFRNDLLFTK